MDDAADISEVSQYWDVLKYVAAGDGLEYFIYGNGKQADNSYQNVVVAFRGTNDITDWEGNTAILSGQKHPQLTYIQQAAEYVAEFNPTYVYATGNSLGGYLAQYFAAYTMQSNPEWAETLQHSSLFNPALLNTKSSSPEDLKQARETTNTFVQQSIVDNSDSSDSAELHKTNSYVIQGEWLSNGYLLFSGLGSYENTTFFTGSGSALDKHKMNQFYANNAKLEDVFSRGYRMDDHYLTQDSDGDGLTDQQEAKIGTNAAAVDSDADGFADILEVKLASNPIDKNVLPDFLDLVNVAEIFGTVSVTVKSEVSTGEVKTKTVNLTAELQNESVVYTLDDATAAESTAYFAA